MRGCKLPARPAKPGDTNSAQRACRPSEPPGSLIDSLLRGRFAPVSYTHLDVYKRQLLTDRIGEAGKRLHTGRSRNDQVALDVRMYARGACRHVRELLLALLSLLSTCLLYTSTIRDNVKMGREDATDDEMIAAARATHAHSFIKRLPEGYDTVITEDGGSLSQGQKQLLCITRVMLCLPPMLILDEATSSIDTRTEQHIQRAFEKLMTGRTSFIVAHRLSTIQTADVILVMNQGDVIEQGTHEELLARGGFYARLYRSQFEQ